MRASNRLRPVVAMALAIATLSACAAAPALETPEPTDVFVPATPLPAEVLEPMGPVLILRAYSGPFENHEQRTRTGVPDVFVLDDGLVVANLEDLPDSVPNWHATRLSETQTQFADVVSALRAAEIQPFAAAGTAAGGHFCADCPTTIIRVDLDGSTIEIAAEALNAQLHDAGRLPLPYPDNLFAVDRLLSQLRAFVKAGPSERYAGLIPRVPVTVVPAG